MPEQSRKARLIVGLMSGTSMDGIDAALVRISGEPTKPRVRLLAFETLPYPPAVRIAILHIATGEATTAGNIAQLNFVLGELFAQAALKVCQATGVVPTRLTAIGSHGQTIYHQGAVGLGNRGDSVKVRGVSNARAGRAGDTTDNLSIALEPACTFQIGEPAVIAERTGAVVVADFRTADMAAGGQGAPLVPMVDYLLLRDARKGTVALNIGGIANVTVIPAGAEPEDVFGFDTGPGNMIVDGLVRHFTDGRKSYDAGGRWAAKGKIIEPLLAEALSHPFFAQHPPKSAGREQFGQQFIDKLFLATNAHTYQRLAPEDLLRTATELTARTIADALGNFASGKIAVHRLVVSGGGTHNRLLMTRLAQLLPKLQILPSDKFGLNVDAKEAISFAILADHTLVAFPGNLPSVTGARRPVVLGRISRPFPNAKFPSGRIQSNGSRVRV